MPVDPRLSMLMGSQPALTSEKQVPLVGWNGLPHSDYISRLAGIQPRDPNAVTPFPAWLDQAPRLPLPNANPNPNAKTNPNSQSAGAKPDAAPQALMDPRAATMMKAAQYFSIPQMNQLATLMKPPSVEQQFLGNVHAMALGQYANSLKAAEGIDDVGKRQAAQTAAATQYLETMGGGKAKMGSPLTSVQAEAMRQGYGHGMVE